MAITQYKLDGNGNIVESIDAMGTSSLFAYDSMNRLVSVKLHRGGYHPQGGRVAGDPVHL